MKGGTMAYAFRSHEINIQRAPSTEPPRVINKTGDLVDTFKEYYEGFDREMVIAVVLDDVNRMLGIYEVSRGGVSESEVASTNVFRPVILMGGSKVLLVHNHPSGDIRPSDGDLRMAKSLFMLASLLDLEVSDNIVLNAESGEYESIHAHPEFRRWLGEDLLKIATLMAGENLSDEQREAADELAKAVADAGL